MKYKVKVKKGFLIGCRLSKSQFIVFLINFRQELEQDLEVIVTPTNSKILIAMNRCECFKFSVVNDKMVQKKAIWPCIY